MDVQATEPMRRSSLSSTLRVGIGLAAWAAVPGRLIAGAGLRVMAAGWHSPVLVPVRRPLGAVKQAAEQRGARAELRVLPHAERMLVGALDEALTAPWSRALVRKGLASPLADAVVEAALRGPMLDAALRCVVTDHVPERLARQLIDAQTVERLISIAGDGHAGVRTADALLGADETARVVRHLLEHPALSRLVAQTLASDPFERRIATMLDEPALDRLIACVLASRAAKSATDQLLASDELHRVVSTIASSDEARAALMSQSAGLATEVADEVRDRTTTVDDGLERAVRRVLRRRSRPAPVVEIDRDHAPS